MPRGEEIYGITRFASVYARQSRDWVREEVTMVSICRAQLGSIFSRKLWRNRYAFAMRKLDMIHMHSPCESICIVGKNKEDGALRHHLLLVYLFVLRNGDIGEQILWENRRLTSDGVVTYSDRGNDNYARQARDEVTRVSICRA